MSFTAGDTVEVISCADDPRATGRIGTVIDEIPPGPLTQGRWTVHLSSLLIGPLLCHTGELRRVQR
ncbi:hypothetical protein KCMC57_65230 (plasmid) [Kitasatospora sp. CMC57]|uniref:DUF1918 domain-containing protein n=1 Tax=Kitasatospora sp. CMC57 TaxID=3231513 RepID=A0AB33KFD0_9ACTN